MKQETKETLKWIKSIIGCNMRGNEQCEPALRLLDKFEEVEQQLTHGGFIPDRNGKPCKDGDRIEMCLDGLRSGRIIHGHLCWNSSSFGFYALEDETEEYLYIDSNSGEVQWFEKEN